MARRCIEPQFQPRIERIEQQNTLNTGKEKDTESGLDYFRARYDGSNMGRFMSPDWSDDPVAIPYSDLSNPPPFDVPPRNLSELKQEFSRKLLERTEAMKKSRFREEQIIGILKQHEPGERRRIFAVSTGSAQRRSTAGSRSLAGWT